MSDVIMNVFMTSVLNFGHLTLIETFMSISFSLRTIVQSLSGQQCGLRAEACIINEGETEAGARPVMLSCLRHRSWHVALPRVTISRVSKEGGREETSANNDHRV
jgi:hypothetical protein